MYNQYFHFTELPFSIAPDPHFMYMSARHQEGLAHLLYGITVGGGFVALTGEVGTGKTTLCHCLLQELPQNIDIALILNPKMNAIELLATICDELAIPYDKHQPSLKTLVDALNQYLLSAHANGRRTVLLIDEAQNLSMEVLEQIRLLTNLETSKTKLLQIILVGQPELKTLLKRRELRQLNQRITARYHLLPLTFMETRSYIRHRLQVCNGNPDLFKDSAIRKIYRLSSGIPRIINILCDRALLGAYASDTQTITPQIVQVAARETLPQDHRQEWRLAILLSLLFLSCVIFAVYYADSLKQLVTSKSTIAVAAKPAQPAVKPSSILPTRHTEKIAFPAQKTLPSPIKFDAWLANPELTLNAALKNALKVFGQTPPASEPLDCESLAAVGFNCLIGRANWKDLLTINRPVILEFPINGELKRHVLLTGIRDGQPVIHHDKELSFPLADLLSYWNGYYLIPWRSPIPDMTLIYQGQTSDNVLWLRQQLAAFDGLNPPATQPRFFDRALVGRVKNFQHTHHLNEDGKVGLQTIFFLDNQADSKSVLRLITSN
ncbi:MAG: ExeA family protein [Methylosarcina sp.]